MSEVRFREGSREVPEYIALRLAGIDTRYLTYEEAMDKANKREMADYLNAEQRKVIREHFERQR